MESQTSTNDSYIDLMEEWARCNASGSPLIADWAGWDALPDELLALQPDLSSSAEEAEQLPDVDLLDTLTETEGLLLGSPLVPLPTPSSFDETEQQLIDGIDIMRELATSTGRPRLAILSTVDRIAGERLTDEDLMDELYGPQPGPSSAIDEGQFSEDDEGIMEQIYQSLPPIADERPMNDPADLLDALYGPQPSPSSAINVQTGGAVETKPWRPWADTASSGKKF